MLARHTLRSLRSRRSLRAQRRSILCLWMANVRRLSPTVLAPPVSAPPVSAPPASAPPAGAPPAGAPPANAPQVTSRQKTAAATLRRLAAAAVRLASSRRRHRRRHDATPPKQGARSGKTEGHSGGRLVRVWDGAADCCGQRSSKRLTPTLVGRWKRAGHRSKWRLAGTLNEAATVLGRARTGQGMSLAKAGGDFEGGEPPRGSLRQDWCQPRFPRLRRRRHRPPQHAGASRVRHARCELDHVGGGLH